MLAADFDVRELLANVPDILARFDSQLRHQFVNHALDGVTGRPASELIGRTQAEVGFDPFLAARWREAMQEVLRTGEPTEFEFELQRAGESRRFHTCMVLEGPAAGARTLLACTRDISRSHRDAERALHVESLINDTLHRVGALFSKELDEARLVELVTDESTRLTGAAYGSFFFNAVDGDGQKYTFFTVSGASREAFKSFPAPRVTPLFAPTFSGEGIVRLDDVTKDPRFGAMGSQPAGHPVILSYLAVPVASRGGEVWGGLFFGHPEPGRFTEQHERLVQGLAAQAAVALENARLYTLVKSSEARARAAERRKDEFLAMLGHELRNPLAPIVTALELMKLKRGSPGDSDRERAVIERQVAHLGRLVDDLLDVARITRGKVELKRERVELAAVVGKAVEISSPLVERRSHQLMVEVPRSGLPIKVDPTRMAQVLANLLTNAAKYTEPGGRIELRVQQRGGEVEISVKDNGIGISPALLPQLFDLFVQGPQTPDRAEGGLGLGLTLVRRLVDLHDGTVEARSDGLGKGSEFLVRLPLALPVDGQPEQSFSAGPVATMSPGLRVLVVDDNADAAELMADLLALDGHDVRAVRDAAAALALLPSFKPQVALLDIGLPVMDGYELATRIRALYPSSVEGAPLRLVAVTGYGQDSDRQRAFEAGFDEHLVKPLDVDRLQQALGVRS